MKKDSDIKEENKLKHSKTRIIVISIISIILLVFLFGIGLYLYLTKQEENTVNEIYNKHTEALLAYSETLEYGSELSYNDLLNKLISMDKIHENTDIKIFINNQEFIKDTTYKFETVGTYKIKVNLSNTHDYTIITKTSKVIENSKESEIIIVDTKPPVISGVSNKEITIGDEINLLDGITAQDELDGQLEVTITGEVNKTKAGEYVIKATATDKSGNVAEEEFKVTVKEKKIVTPTPSPNTSSSSNKKPSSSNSTTSQSKPSTTTPTQANDASTKSGRLQLATAEARRVVSQIITPGMSDYQKASAIFNYLHRNVSLQTNQSNEAYKTNYGNEAYAALIMKKAACSGFCKAVTLMCNAAGLQSKHINANQWAHQWNTVYIDGEWIVLDAQGGIFGGTQHPLE